MTIDSNEWLSSLDAYCDRFQAEWIAMRRYLHQNPELSDSEFETSRFLSERLSQLGLTPEVPSDGRGVTADLASSREVACGRRIAIRGDIDALPIEDGKPVEYHSRCEGVMHACGHDVHATVVYGAMQLLSALNADQTLPWPINVRSILQPSEEIATGAQYMIDRHALRDVDHILALHVDPTRPLGRIGLRVGAFTAACDMVHVQFNGRGGHGARPHLTIDPIDAATRWVQSAFRRLGRSAEGIDEIVFSVGQISAGQTANIIPDVANLSGTLRSLDRQQRLLALGTLEEVCNELEHDTDCEVVMHIDVSAPGVVNDGSMIDLLELTAKQVLTTDGVEWIDSPSMGSEDFSYYLEQIPGAMFRLGVAGEQVGGAPLHTSLFDIDERAITIGCKIFAAAVVNYFRNGSAVGR